MPTLFKNKTSSSKSNRPPAGGSVSSEQHAAVLTAGGGIENWNAAQQQYRPVEQQPPVYAQGFVAQAPGVRQSFDRPPVDVAASVNASQIQQAADPRQEYRQSYNPQFVQPPQQVQQPLQQAQEPKRGIRERLFGHSSRESVDQTQAKPPSRTASFRRKDSPHKHSSPTDESVRKGSAYWSSRQSSTGNLPISHEADEEGPIHQYNPNINQSIPSVPPKDPVNVQYYSQQTLQQHPQFAPSSLQRADTGQTSSSQGQPDIYSASEYSAGSIQATPQLNQYTDAQADPDQQHFQQSPPLQQSQLPPHLQYQSFSPTHQPSTAAQISQAQQGAGTGQRYSYYQQQQTAAQQQQAGAYSSPGVGQNQTRSSQQSHQEPQTAQPPSYQSQVPEIHQPQAVRGTLQVQQHADSPSHLHPARPPSGQHHFVPPSPLSQVQGQASVAYETTASSPAPPSSSSESSNQQQGLASPPISTQNPAQAQVQPQRKVLDMPSKGTSHPTRESSFQPQPQQVPQSAAVRSSGGQPQQAAEVGRNTPPPRLTNDMSEDEANQFKQLEKDYKELRDKYQKVKKYYFEKESQVHALQNTLAHQRLSQSRTSLDDSEYSTRFARLDGLIAQLAFAIRKEWKSIPIWLQPGVNKEAVTTGKQEMTAVGRAFISSWLVEEVFDMYFHPDLEQGLSMQLKQVQMNIRKFAPPFQTDEEEEALGSKVINWRLTTLEGLQQDLKGQQAQAHRQRLTETLQERLIASLSMHLQEPAPPDLTGGVHMIIELVVGIAGHLPCESRDVVIDYFPPGFTINSELMKLESGIPPLTNPMADLPDAAQTDRASLKSTTSDLRDSVPQTTDDGSAPGSATTSSTTSPNATNPGAKEDRKRGGGSMLSGLMGTRKPNQPTQPQQGKIPGASGSQTSLTQQPPGSSGGPKDESGAPPRVRIAAFLAVQIRGRSILAKAPVYTSN
ncbi:hypothetical protein NA57DRAFT_50556 [Rhizodiscina lignyota]|uniref:Uncharacterized protein n=1 Tax=Rhizodiscina lignyota TaxID=1504668 RepID=A0A9P4IQ61_9PEZI|nr:hypothetical protein NA57DRAFT_50556 [Rhizodiscina lignyota]